jgi:hypothetical protein
VLANKRWLLLLMSVLALALGAARGAAALSSSPLVVHAAKPNSRLVKGSIDVDRAVLRRYRAVLRSYRARTWRWQATMGRPLTRRAVHPANLRTLRFWQRAARRAYVAYVHPPHRRAWLCIHRYEGSWQDSGDPYWGGLQMDRGFMEGYAPHHLLRRGWADNWSPLEQMWVAERAYRTGRGYYAWPNTARVCGLI